MKIGLKVIAWFKEIGKGDIAIAGGKGANLGELTRSRIPVPPGFVVTASAYYRFLEEAGLMDTISSHLDNLDVQNSQKLDEAANLIKEMINNVAMPAEIAAEIRKAYEKMGGGHVAVRSSATAEDLPEASFAGQQRTFLNVNGADNVVKAVQGCWASLYEPRAVFYRVEQGFDHLKVGIAVPVQKMVQAEKSGVVFTVEPMSSDRDKIVIEAAFGLGEAVVSGALTPDLYIVDKKSLRILNKTVARQEWQLVRNPAGTDYEDCNYETTVAEDLQNARKLSDEEITTLAKIAKSIEDHYLWPQDIEWAMEDGKFYIVQTRPVTTLKEQWDGEVEGVLYFTREEILSGLAASPGVAAGQVQIVYHPSEIHKVEAGQILVAEMTTPDYVPAMKRAAAIVTDKGGRTCHAAIVSRELGVPCVVGTVHATKTLQDGQVVTVHGMQGKVYEGEVTELIEAAAPCEDDDSDVETMAKVYVNLANPDFAERMATKRVDGVGLLRAEFMIAGMGEHPRYMLKENRGHEFVDKLVEGLTTFAAAFNPRPVVYRMTDFKTNEYRNLKGGEEFEEEEENPMIGYRGCSRYVCELDLFKLEIEAIKKVRETYSNLWVMLPFVRTVKELEQTKMLMEQQGLVRSEDFKLWMMVEVPSNVILLDKFIDVGLDGLSIGSNDLTQLILGIDRESSKLADGFDERDEAVLWALEKTITTAKERGISCSICGQAPSVYPELTRNLVEWGITSVSANPDMVEQTRRIIAEAEQKLGRSSG